MIGAGTALADDPHLTCRLPGLGGWSSVRIVLDRGLRLPLPANLVPTARETLPWLVTSAGGAARKITRLTSSHQCVSSMPSSAPTKNKRILCSRLLDNITNHSIIY